LIIPAINCPDFSEASKHIRIAERFLPPSTGWIHIDVSDGKFGNVKSWRDPEEFRSMGVRLNVEVHLMVENPELVARGWLEAGARRLIVPVQAVTDFEGLVKLAKKYKAEVAPSFDMSISAEDSALYARKFEFVHLLAVEPGPSGQEFNPAVLEKLRFLRGQNRGVRIEIDGGINPDTAIEALGAGADVLVSGSYIFKNEDPAEAYRELENFI
jgi:ribulose-phosphate 3-epimerase